MEHCSVPSDPFHSYPGAFGEESDHHTTHLPNSIAYAIRSIFMVSGGAMLGTTFGSLAATILRNLLVALFPVLERYLVLRPATTVKKGVAHRPVRPKFMANHVGRGRGRGGRGLGRGGRGRHSRRRTLNAGYNSDSDMDLFS
ncbi:hypothetical protein BJ741DRAFT_659679 [Chytriomyces cf. hyalinus JEL632]|nr:hypothetical protein BJ741DRAFT_659679 [Chytriomyces cf. hyalinus JEL632]